MSSWNSSGKHNSHSCFQLIDSKLAFTESKSFRLKSKHLNDKSLKSGGDGVLGLPWIVWQHNVCNAVVRHGSVTCWYMAYEVRGVWETEIEDIVFPCWLRDVLAQEMVSHEVKEGFHASYGDACCTWDNWESIPINAWKIEIAQKTEVVIIMTRYVATNSF